MSEVGFIQLLEINKIESSMSQLIINYLWENPNGCISIIKEETYVHNFRHNDYLYAINELEINNGILRIEILTTDFGFKHDTLTRSIFTYLQFNEILVISKREFEHAKGVLSIDGSPIAIKDFSISIFD